MKVIELHPLSIFDLNQRFARVMGGNRIRHYVVSSIAPLVGGMNAQEIVKNYIRDEEGDVEVKFLPMSMSPRSPDDKNTIQAKDITNILLKDNPEIIENVDVVNEVARKAKEYQNTLKIHRTPKVEPDGGLITNNVVIEDALGSISLEEAYARNKT